MDFSRLDKFLQEHLWYYGFHGCDVGIVYKGETVYRKGFGVSDDITGKKIDGNEMGFVEIMKKQAYNRQRCNQYDYMDLDFCKSIVLRRKIL